MFQFGALLLRIFLCGHPMPVDVLFLLFLKCSMRNVTWIFLLARSETACQHINLKENPAIERRFGVGLYSLCPFPMAKNVLGVGRAHLGIFRHLFRLVRQWFRVVYYRISHVSHEYFLA